jgi:hypothetical protein
MLSNDDIDMDMMMGGESIQVPTPGDDLAMIGCPVTTVQRTTNQTTTTISSSNGSSLSNTGNGHNMNNNENPLSDRSAPLNAPPPPPSLRPAKSGLTTRSAPAASTNAVRPGAYSVQGRAVGSRPAWHRRMSQRLGAHIAAPFAGGRGFASPRRSLLTMMSSNNNNNRNTRNNRNNNNRRASRQMDHLPPEMRVQMSNRNSLRSGGGDSTSGANIRPPDIRYPISDVTTQPIREESSALTTDAECVPVPRNIQIKDDDDDDEKKLEGDVRVGMVIILCISLVIIAIIVAVYVAVSGNSEPEVVLPPTSAPPPGGSDDDGTTTVDTTDILKSRIEYLSSDPRVLEDTSSPQFFALNWLANLDHAEIDIDDLERLEARYALATFYFSTDGESWNDDMQFLSSNHECNWTSVTVLGNGVSCNQNYQITGLTIGTWWYN